MLTPYIQDVSKWIQYYKHSGTSSSNTGLPSENQYVSDSGGLAKESNMSLAKVEPNGPPPKAPLTGPSASLHNVTPSEESVVQAAYTAKRVQIENKQSRGRPPVKPNGKKKKTISGGVSKATKKVKQKHLFGSPGDIFKSKIANKTK